MKEWEENKDKQLIVPLRPDGNEYSFHALYPDQKQVVAKVMSKVKEFMETDDLDSFQPLRMTLNGPGGSGKSVVINTIITMLRKMYNSNDVVKCIAPTGTAAFNIQGETFHRFGRNHVTKKHYVPNSMDAEKRKLLIKQNRLLLVLIADERSLINSCDFGTVECQLSETNFDGGFLRHMSFGGLPVVLLAGDDQQLPGAKEGAFNALINTGGTAMTMRGRAALIECARFVMELPVSKRMTDSAVKQRELLSRLRQTEELTDKEKDKLLSLHLDMIEQLHSPKVVENIKRKAIYLFFTNEKRIRHNIQHLKLFSSSDNPVAMMQPQSTGQHGGKGVTKHFEAKFPNTAMMCVGSRVAIEHRNFQPLWGLHNGACGTVDEIVYAKGDSPNKGNLPSYVVVNFPLYCGPAWDLDNPKVRPILLWHQAHPNRN